MQHKLPALPVRIAAAVLLLGILGYFGYQFLTNSNNGKITASGSIEATIVNIAPEMAGKVKNVLVEEGQPVEADEALIQLDPELLAAQRAVAAANLATAQAGAQSAQEALNAAKNQYQIILETALAQDKKTRAQDWFSKDPNQFEQPDWYFSRAEQIQSAQTQVDAAFQVWQDAQAALQDANLSVEKAAFLSAEKNLLDTRLAYLTAKDVDYLAQKSADANAPVGRYNRAHCGTNQGYTVKANPKLTNLIYGCSGDDYLTSASETIFDAAEKESNDAEKAYDALLDTQAAEDVLTLRANVSVTQELYYAALDRLRQLQTGEQSSAVAAAESAYQQAQAAAEQAQKAAAQAQANLDLMDTQIAKLEIRSPMNGVILTRNVEPGEFVQPGAAALSLGDLENLTITVYVPENLYGKISLGQKAEVRVDSFPELTFTANVIQIADQAEFTPRNVQTVEGRSSTFYAIKLKVNDPEKKLKIGMPADVVFE